MLFKFAVIALVSLLIASTHAQDSSGSGDSATASTVGAGVIPTTAGPAAGPAAGPEGSPSNNGDGTGTTVPPAAGPVAGPPSNNGDGAGTAAPPATGPAGDSSPLPTAVGLVTTVDQNALQNAGNAGNQGNVGGQAFSSALAAAINDFSSSALNIQALTELYQNLNSRALVSNSIDTNALQQASQASTEMTAQNAINLNWVDIYSVNVVASLVSVTAAAPQTEFLELLSDVVFAAESRNSVASTTVDSATLQALANAANTLNIQLPQSLARDTASVINSLSCPYVGLTQVGCNDQTSADAFFALATRMYLCAPAYASDPLCQEDFYEIKQEGLNIVWVAASQSVVPSILGASTTANAAAITLVVVGLVACVFAVTLVARRAISSRNNRRIAGVAAPSKTAVVSVLKVREVQGPTSVRSWTDAVDV